MGRAWLSWAAASRDRMNKQVPSPIVQDAAVDFIGRARALAPMIAAGAAEIEARRELTPEIVAALHDGGLFRLLLPRSLGGHELSPLLYVQVLEELAKADASTAWCVAQTSGASTL